MSWIARTFRRRNLCDDLSEEIQLHMEQSAEQLMGEGMSRQQAEQQARRAFGNRALVEQHSREVWQWPTLLLGLLATWILAQRALSIDPLMLLRED